MDFWEIHDQYYRRVRGFILSLVRDESLADDLVQETFIRIQQNQDRLRDPSKMSSWIFRIAYNVSSEPSFCRELPLSGYMSTLEFSVNPLPWMVTSRS